MLKLKQKSFSNFFILGLLLTLTGTMVLTTTRAFAGVSINLGGGNSTNFSGNRTIDESSYSLGLTVDLLTMVRVSYGFKHKVTESEGRFFYSLTDEWVKYTTEEYEDTHSANVILVLFETQFLAPYVFGGVAQKTYEYVQTINIEGAGKSTSGPETLEVPQYGIGLGIQFSQSFSLKLSNTWTEVSAKDFDFERQDFISVTKQASEFEITASYRL